MDIAKKELYIKKSKETFKISSVKSNHWKLPIQRNKSQYKDTETLVLHVAIEDMSWLNLKKHIIKTHKILCHKSEKQLLLLFKMAGKDDQRTRNVIKEVID